MIGAGEIRARALRLRLLPAHIEKDYVLNHVLAALADGDAGLVFRGGTALARIYWPDYRLSEDLDFITSPRVSDLRDPLDQAIRRAGESAGMALQLRAGRVRNGWLRSAVTWGDGSIVLDVIGGERAYLPVERRPLSLPYTDLAGKDRVIDVVALPEILGNKWWMLDDRQEPRDLFDLWAGLCGFDVPFDRVAEGYRAKFGGTPGIWHLERAKAVKDRWELRLSHQVADLPSFEEAYEAVRIKCEEWSRRREDG